MRELQRVEGVLQRMEAGEQLVEKMRLYATEQEVMDMQPFIKGSLEELQRLQLPAAGDRAQPRDLSECKARLQALVERVTGHPGEDLPGGWIHPSHRQSGVGPAQKAIAQLWVVQGLEPSPSSKVSQDSLL